MPQIEQFTTTPPDRVFASIGGSMVRPDRLNQLFIDKLIDFSASLINQGITTIYMVGGGGDAKKAIADLRYRKVDDESGLDEVGIKITEVNAQMLTLALSKKNIPVTLIDRQEARERGAIFKCGDPKPGCVYVCPGINPGYSSDTVTVNAAIEACQAFVYNVSNTPGVYPVRDLFGQKLLNRSSVIERLTWSEFKHLIPKKFKAGGKYPFDPVAADLAQSKGITAILIGGNGYNRLFSNFQRSLKGEQFLGTIIGPD